MINNKKNRVALTVCRKAIAHICYVTNAFKAAHNFIIMKPKLLKENIKRNNNGELLSLFECPYCKGAFHCKKYSINTRHTKSCGCASAKLRIEGITRHGMCNTDIYKRWKKILSRVKKYQSCRKHYYDKGVTVCDEWQKFEPFRDWALANGYKKELAIDRIDNDGNYSPDNCRWVTLKENNQNTSRTLRANQVIEIKKRLANGEKPKDIANNLSIKIDTIWNIRSKRRWSNITI